MFCTWTKGTGCVSVYDQQPLWNNHVLPESTQYQGLLRKVRHVLLLQWTHISQIKKKVTDWYILVHQHVYQFWAHSPLHFLLLHVTSHRYTKHNLSSRLHGNKFHNIMNRILRSTWCNLKTEWSLFVMTVVFESCWLQCNGWSASQ